MLSFKLTQCLSYHDLSHDNMKWDGFGIGVYFLNINNICLGWNS